jgi:hypothetical protein
MPKEDPSIVRTFRRPAFLALMAPLLFVPAALAGAASDPAPTAPPPASAPAAVPVTGHRPVEPTLIDPRPVPIDDVIETADPATVLVTFWAGPEACEGVQRVDVDETPEEVRLAVFLGQRVPGQVCALVAEHAATAVTLAAPLGDRAVIDAHAPSPRPCARLTSSNGAQMHVPGWNGVRRSDGTMPEARA